MPKQRMTQLMKELEESLALPPPPRKSTLEKIMSSRFWRYSWLIPLGILLTSTPLIIDSLTPNTPQSTLEAVVQQPLLPNETYLPAQAGLQATQVPSQALAPLDRNSIIFFPSFADTLFSVMPDGSDLTQLLYLQSPDTMRVSRDRTKLVFLDGYPINLEDPNIYLLDLRTGQPIQIDTGYDAIISPNSSKIAYLKQLDYGETALFTLTPGGNSTKKYTFSQDYEHVRLMDWKSDGRFVMLLDCDIVYFSGGESQVILEHNSAWGTTCDPWIHELRLSPDERYIAYTEGGGLTTLHIIRADGSGEEASIDEYDVNDALGVSSTPFSISFSPDSRKIGFPCDAGYCIYDISSKRWTNIPFEELGGSMSLADW
jgi:hypothetical protein